MAGLSGGLLGQRLQTGGRRVAWAGLWVEPVVGTLPGEVPSSSGVSERQVLSRQGTESLLVWLEATHISSLNPTLRASGPTARGPHQERKPTGWHVLAGGHGDQVSPTLGLCSLLHCPVPRQPSSPCPSQTYDQGLR